MDRRSFTCQVDERNGKWGSEASPELRKLERATTSATTASAYFTKPSLMLTDDIGWSNERKKVQFTPTNSKMNTEPSSSDYFLKKEKPQNHPSGVNFRMNSPVLEKNKAKSKEFLRKKHQKAEKVGFKNKRFFDNFTGEFESLRKSLILSKEEMIPKKKPKSPRELEEEAQKKKAETVSYIERKKEWADTIDPNYKYRVPPKKRALYHKLNLLTDTVAQIEKIKATKGLKYLYNSDEAIIKAQKKQKFNADLRVRFTQDGKTREASKMVSPHSLRHSASQNPFKGDEFLELKSYFMEELSKFVNEDLEKITSDEKNDKVDILRKRIDDMYEHYAKSKNFPKMVQYYLRTNLGPTQRFPPNEIVPKEKNQENEENSSQPSPKGEKRKREKNHKRKKSLETVFIALEPQIEIQRKKEGQNENGDWDEDDEEEKNQELKRKGKKGKNKHEIKEVIPETFHVDDYLLEKSRLHIVTSPVKSALKVMRMQEDKVSPTISKLKMEDAKRHEVKRVMKKNSTKKTMIFKAIDKVLEQDPEKINRLTSFNEVERARNLFTRALCKAGLSQAAAQADLLSRALDYKRPKSTFASVKKKAPNELKEGVEESKALRQSTSNSSFGKGLTKYSQGQNYISRVAPHHAELKAKEAKEEFLREIIEELRIGKLGDLKSNKEALYKFQKELVASLSLYQNALFSFEKKSRRKTESDLREMERMNDKLGSTGVVLTPFDKKLEKMIKKDIRKDFTEKSASKKI